MVVFVSFHYIPKKRARLKTAESPHLVMSFFFIFRELQFLHGMAEKWRGSFIFGDSFWGDLRNVDGNKANLGVSYFFLYRRVLGKTLRVALILFWGVWWIPGKIPLTTN